MATIPIDDIIRELGITAQLKDLITKVSLLTLRNTLNLPRQNTWTLLKEYLEVE